MYYPVLIHFILLVSEYRQIEIQKHMDLKVEIVENRGIIGRA